MAAADLAITGSWPVCAPSDDADDGWAALLAALRRLQVGLDEYERLDSDRPPGDAPPRDSMH